MIRNAEEIQAQPGVSVIVVSYNTKTQLRKCLSHLIAEPHLEIIVVDNASSDGSVEMVKSDFPSVFLMASPENVGFGRANNLGIEAAKNDLVLFLNSDAYAAPGAIAKLANVFEDREIVAAGGKLLNSDGTLQESVTRNLNLWFVLLEQLMIEPLLRKLRLGYWVTPFVQKDPVTEVHQVMGACLMMRKSIGESFDPRFFLYCEDTELCYRLSSHGKIVYVRDAEFTHELGASSSGDRWKSVSRYNTGKELYFRIHFGRTASTLCWLLNRLGAILRILISGVLAPIRPAHREKVRTFFKVLTQKP